MTVTTSLLRPFPTKSDASDYVADLMVDAAQRAIHERGAASLLLSGGSTPGPAYESFSKADLAWDKVRIGLVDDRRVPETDPGSNSALIRRSILNGPATSTKFVPMASDHDYSSDVVSDISSAMASLTQAPDLCLMGMGTDGHTASWFPGAVGLEKAIDINTSQNLVSVDATGCPVAGNYPYRITVTLPVIMRARHIVLFITGEAKKSVWEEAIEKSVFENPVKALYAAGERLTVIWAP